MNRRLVILFTAAALLWVLAVPASSLASGAYAVKNTAGKKVGSVNGAACGKVWDAAGTYVGNIGRTDEGGFITRAGTYDSCGYAEPGVGTTFMVRGLYARHWQGRAVRSSARYWILQKRVSGAWHRRGTVAAGSSGWTAVAALRLLLWN